MIEISVDLIHVAEQMREGAEQDKQAAPGAEYKRDRAGVTDERVVSAKEQQC
jgi:hypothetical protein